MLFLIIGLLGLILKYLEVAPVSELSWWVIFAPFGLAVAWWSWADFSGYTKRKEIEKMADRKTKRIDKQREAMGLPVKKPRR